MKKLEKQHVLIWAVSLVLAISIIGIAYQNRGQITTNADTVAADKTLASIDAQETANWLVLAGMMADVKTKMATPANVTALKIFTRGQALEVLNNQSFLPDSDPTGAIRTYLYKMSAVIAAQEPGQSLLDQEKSYVMAYDLLVLGDSYSGISHPGIYTTPSPGPLSKILGIGVATAATSANKQPTPKKVTTGTVIKPTQYQQYRKDAIDRLAKARDSLAIQVGTHKLSESKADDQLNAVALLLKIDPLCDSDCQQEIDKWMTQNNVWVQPVTSANAGIPNSTPFQTPAQTPASVGLGQVWYKVQEMIAGNKDPQNLASAAQSILTSTDTTFAAQPQAVNDSGVKSFINLPLSTAQNGQAQYGLSAYRLDPFALTVRQPGTDSPFSACTKSVINPDCDSDHPRTIAISNLNGTTQAGDFMFPILVGNKDTALKVKEKRSVSISGAIMGAKIGSAVPVIGQVAGAIIGSVFAGKQKNDGTVNINVGGQNIPLDVYAGLVKAAGINIPFGLATGQSEQEYIQTICNNNPAVKNCPEVMNGIIHRQDKAAIAGRTQEGYDAKTDFVVSLTGSVKFENGKPYFVITNLQTSTSAAGTAVTISAASNPAQTANGQFSNFFDQAQSSTSQIGSQTPNHSFNIAKIEGQAKYELKASADAQSFIFFAAPVAELSVNINPPKEAAKNISLSKSQLDFISQFDQAVVMPLCKEAWVNFKDPVTNQARNPKKGEPIPITINDSNNKGSHLNFAFDCHSINSLSKDYNYDKKLQPIIQQLLQARNGTSGLLLINGQATNTIKLTVDRIEASIPKTSAVNSAPVSVDIQYHIQKFDVNTALTSAKPYVYFMDPKNAQIRDDWFKQPQIGPKVNLGNLAQATN